MKNETTEIKALSKKEAIEISVDHIGGGWKYDYCITRPASQGRYGVYRFVR